MGLSRDILNSSALLIAIRLVQRSLGLVSLLILARLLTPSDFGLVALVSITVYFFDILSNAGTHLYIVQKENVDDEDLDTAWTVDLMLKGLLWSLLQFCAEPISNFYDRPELELALGVGSCILLINAAANPALNLHRQRFDYRQIFWLSVIQRLGSFAAVVAAAWIFRSYWALIGGDLVASLIFTTGSYFADKFRPRISFAKWQLQWRFSGWILLKNVVGYARSQIDTLVVSKLFPAASLGQYYLVRDIAMLPAQNLIAPALEPLLALFRRSRSTPLEISQHMRIALFAVAACAIPVTGFIATYSLELIELLLGSQWGNASPVLQAMSLLLLYFSFSLVFENFFIATNRVRLLFWLDLGKLALIALGLAAVLSLSHELVDVAYARGATGILNLYITYWICKQCMPITKVIPWRAFSVVTLATAISLLIASSAETPTLPATLSFLLQTFVFVTAYSALLVVAMLREKTQEGVATRSFLHSVRKVCVGFVQRR